MTNKIKKLEHKKDFLKKEKDRLIKDQSNIQRKIANINKELKEINKEIKDHDKNIEISDHAMLRYIERVLDVDVESLKKELSSKLSKTDIVKIGDCDFPFNGHKAIIRNKNLITIY